LLQGLERFQRILDKLVLTLSLGHFRQFDIVVQFPCQVAHGLDGAGQACAFAHHGLGAVRVVPKLGVLGQMFDLVQTD
jgi:hypothetical protein